jgi:hypothetical protein
MGSAYNTTWLHNLAVIKETKRWYHQGLISKTQLSNIQEAYPSGFYHPNIIIRILLFVATLLALSGITGLLTLMVADAGEQVIWPACIIYGIISFFILEVLFITQNKHYKSGVTEALMYHACVFAIIGFAGLTDFDNMLVILLVCFIICSFAAIRYLDLINTVVAFISLAGILFYEFYEGGDIYQQVIPFVFIIFFTPVYFISKKMKNNQHAQNWINNLIVVESLSLLLIYASGNYLVVRELSTNLMGLAIEESSDIPFAFVFYFLTVIIPMSYLYFGIVKKDAVLLRVSLFVIAFSVFTFKYYYGFGHPEITLTLAGILLTGITLLLLNYLKIVRNGFTRENLLAEKWGDVNIQAILISQTMGGNQVGSTESGFKGEGGEFGGGGATGDF